MQQLLEQEVVLDHIAIAVAQLDSAKKIFEDIGLRFNPHVETVESQKVNTVFAQIEKDAHLELVSALNNEGPIQKFIEKNGEGIHHLCFKVANLQKTCESLSAKGYKLIYPEPRVGANNRMINFIHPSSTGGTLIELCAVNASAL